MWPASRSRSPKRFRGGGEAGSAKDSFDEMMVGWATADLRFQGAAGILPAEESESSSADETSAAPCWRHYSTRLKFMVPMHGIKVVEAFHEPAWPSNRSPPWESGAEAARTPNADASFADPAASAKRLECVRFISAFRPARHGQRFMAPMHDFGIERALHEPPGEGTGPTGC